MVKTEYKYITIKIPKFLNKFFKNKRSTIRISSDLYDKSLAIYENQYSIQEIITNLLITMEKQITYELNKKWLNSLNSIVNTLLIQEIKKFNKFIF